MRIQSWVLILSNPNWGYLCPLLKGIMKRLIICVLLYALAIAILIPAIANAKITASKSPKVISCGTALKLGVTARHHSGSRRVKIRIYTGKRLVFKRTVRATKHFRKQLACGKTYRIVYRMPSGRKVTRKVKVRRGAGAGGQGLPATPYHEQTPLTPAEQQQEAQDQVEEDAMEACDTLNEQHEDDPDWDPFACMGPDDDTDESEDDDPADDEEDEEDE